jgi:hypothetical protein
MSLTYEQYLNPRCGGVDPEGTGMTCSNTAIAWIDGVGYCINCALPNAPDAETAAAIHALRDEDML